MANFSCRNCGIGFDETTDPGKNVCSACRTKLVEEGGVKFDMGKPQWELLPPDALDEIAKVLTYGAKKYKARNWEAGMSWSRPFGACMRHMWAWWRGEDYDKETGIHHLAHAGCCIHFLLAYAVRTKRGQLSSKFDDRFILPETASSAGS